MPRVATCRLEFVQPVTNIRSISDRMQATAANGRVTDRVRSGWIQDAREWAGGSLSRIVGMPSHWRAPLIGDQKKKRKKERSKGAVGMMDSCVTSISLHSKTQIHAVI